MALKFSEEQFQPGLYVTFIGFEPIPPSEQSMPAAEETPATQKSCSRTFGPYSNIEVADDDDDPNEVLKVYASSTVFSPEADEPQKADLDDHEPDHLASFVDGVWKLRDGLGEENGQTFKWLRVHQKIPGL